MATAPDSIRFQFGENWRNFLASVDQSRVEAAARSLSELLDGQTLAGKSFLDIGCGSGLASLAANLAGAEVTSFDADDQSVLCTETLRRRCLGQAPSTSEIVCSAGPDLPGPTAPHTASPWQILTGSILAPEFVEGLGSFDVVYAWGVLHHTGRMWQAIEAACDLVAPDGHLVLAIYHDQGGASRRWAAIKRGYHRLPATLRPAYVAMIAGCWELRFALARLLAGRNPLPFADWRAKRQDRGMSVWHDWIDWVGGWPFEVASPDEVIDRLIRKDFVLRRLKTVGNGWGCNEYVFRRSA